MKLVDQRVVIIGGGVAGLAAAYQLHRDGIPFVVLESRDRAGGVVLSEEIDGFTIDGGPDGLLVQKPEGIALCQELGLGERLVPTKPPRLAYIQRGGQLHAAAGRVGARHSDANRSVPRAPVCSRGPASCAWARSCSCPRGASRRDESIGAFMTRRFGREAAAYLAEPLLAGIHAGDVDRLSLQALFPRFVAG